MSEIQLGWVLSFLINVQMVFHGIVSKLDSTKPKTHAQQRGGGRGRHHRPSEVLGSQHHALHIQQHL